MQWNMHDIKLPRTLLCLALRSNAKESNAKIKSNINVYRRKWFFPVLHRIHSYTHTHTHTKEKKREINDTPKQLNMKYDDPKALTFPVANHCMPLHSVWYSSCGALFLFACSLVLRTLNAQDINRRFRFKCIALIFSLSFNTLSHRFQFFFSFHSFYLRFCSFTKSCDFFEPISDNCDAKVE